MYDLIIENGILMDPKTELQNNWKYWHPKRTNQSN